MPSIKWQPFRDQGRIPQELDQFGEQEEWMPSMPSFRIEEPQMDIYQDNDNIYVEIPLTGINPNNVEISIKDNILTVSGKVEEKKEKKEKDYLRREIRRGGFRRAVKLPVAVKENKAKAESELGILKIVIPKAEKGSPQLNKIPIQVK